MNNAKTIEELIQQYCPDGVEMVKLISVADVLYGCPFDATLFTEDDSYIPLIRIRDILPGTPSTYLMGDYDSKYIIHKGDILVGMDGNFNLAKWNSRDGVLCQRSCKISAKEGKSIDGYLFHLLKPLFKQIEDNTPGGSVKHLSAKAINAIEIPLPPLPVQEEIVRILDAMLGLVDKLDEEIKSRQKQYEHYREELLTFGDEIKKTPIWQLTDWDKRFQTVEKHKQTKIYTYPVLLAKDLFALDTPNGDVRLLSTGTQEGWTTEEMAGDNLCEGEIVSIPWGKSEGAKAPVKYHKGKFVTADNRIATSKDTTILKNKYLFYWLMTQTEELDKIYRGASILHPHMGQVLDMEIPLPPLSVQQEIVQKLDAFEELIQALQAERDLRQKQYEYYREKLLTF